MAIYSLSAGVFSRSKGHRATSAAAYRSGSLIHDQTIGARFDYTRKQGVLWTTILAPDNAPAWVHDREQLWNAVERGERRSDSQLAREVLVALPHELDEAAQIALVRGFVQEEFIARGMVADISIHAPSREGDDRNVHSHIMLTLRPIEGDGFAKKKARQWNSDELLAHWREAWADHCNTALEAAGSAARVSHLSLEAQGIDRMPGTHEGKRATALERQGIASDRGDRNREASGYNATLDQLVSELAALDTQIAKEQEARLFGEGFEGFDLPPAADAAVHPPLPELLPDAGAEEAQVQAAAGPFLADIGQRGETHELGQGGFTWWERGAQIIAEAMNQARDFARQTWQRFLVREDKDRDTGREIG